jgi:hypothetical protein
MTICFLGHCLAQECKTVKQVDPANGGGYVVEVDRKKFRTVTADQLFAWQELQRQSDLDKKDLALANAQIENLQGALELAKRDAVIAQQDAKLEHGNFVRAMAMYDGEKKLREQAETFIPHGAVNSFFNNPIVRVANEFGKPLLQSWITSRMQRR